MSLVKNEVTPLLTVDNWVYRESYTVDDKGKRNVREECGWDTPFTVLIVVKCLPFWFRVSVIH